MEAENKALKELVEQAKLNLDGAYGSSTTIWTKLDRLSKFLGRLWGERFHPGDATWITCWNRAGHFRVIPLMEPAPRSVHSGLPLGTPGASPSLDGTLCKIWFWRF